MRNYKKLPFLNMKGALLSFIFIFSFSFCGAQSWVWGAEGTTVADIYGVAADQYGNGYLAGFFGDSIKFGSHLLKANSQDAFLIKYEPNGNISWAWQSQSKSWPNECSAIYTSCDRNGDILLTGFMSDTVIFGNDTVKTTNPQSVFLSKYDNNGNVLWVQNSGGKGEGEPESVNTDLKRNIYVTGVFFDSISFGTHTLVNQSSSNYLTFLTKYDFNGNALWAKQATHISNNGQCASTSVVVDNYGNAYISGIFFDTISFGTDTLITNSANGGDAFLVKYDTAGNVLWAEQSQSESTSFCNSYSVITDEENNAYITGTIFGKVLFGADTLKGYRYNSNDYGDIFLVKYDQNGNIRWVKQSKSSGGGWAGFSLSKDTLNNFYLSAGGNVGIKPGNITFNGSDTFSYNSSYHDPSLIIKIDTSGNTLCGSIINTGGDDENTVASDPSGFYIYLGGDIASNLIINTDTLNSYNTEVPFIARWQPCRDTNIETSIPQISNTPSLSLFPNPNAGAFTIAFVGSQNFVPENIEFYNMMGQKVYSAYPPQTPKGALIAVNIANQPDGIYLYRVMDNSGALVGEGKFVIEK